MLIRTYNFTDSTNLVYTKTEDSFEGALWLASQNPNILCYLPHIYYSIPSAIVLSLH